jgi:hypothetical protein
MIRGVAPVVAYRFSMHWACIEYQHRAGRRVLGEDMPGMNGYELAVRGQEERKTLKA